MGVDGQSVRVGALVHRVVDIGAGEEPCDGMMTFLSAEGYTKSIIVTAICKRDKCVELEHTFALTHTQFGLLEVPDGAGCPQDHEWKCAHLGHKGKCRHRCMDCGGWWTAATAQRTPSVANVPSAVMMRGPCACLIDLSLTVK